MRSVIPALAVAAFAAPAFAADPAEGLWMVQSGSAKVRIGPCAGRADRLCGAIAWVRDPKQAVAHDERNPDPTLRARPIMGLLMIRDFKAAGAGRWTGGKIYDPETGKTYDSKLKVERDGTLKVEGCILMICKAQTWRRS